MKKTFSLVHPKIKPARLVDSAKFEIKKYLKRERKKKLPEGFECWFFDCKFGVNEAEAVVVDLNEINTLMNKALAEELESFYLEILARPVLKPARSNKDPEEGLTV
jgi:hypothetical protein